MAPLPVAPAPPKLEPPALSEVMRVQALRSLQVLDQPRRADLDGIARLAAHVCGAPTAAINLIDLSRHWSAAAYGCESAPVAREDSMCSTSILSRDVSYTPDASADTRWADNPFVNGVLDELKFYAAAPLILGGGEVIGTVCAFSCEAVELTRTQIERLRDLADLAVELLELREATDRLAHAALRDPLTGLPNRALFCESLDLALARHERGESATAVLFLDLDGFKGVNDEHGHAAGDQLLNAVAERLLATMRGADLVARFGGDEFAVLCESPAPRRSRPDAVVTRLRRAFERPFRVGDRDRTIGLSIGVANADGSPAAQLLVRADVAMYADKCARRLNRALTQRMSRPVIEVASRSGHCTAGV